MCKCLIINGYVVFCIVENISVVENIFVEKL